MNERLNPEDMGHGIYASVYRSILAADHLKVTDEGAVQLALDFARQIEDSLEAGESKIMFGPGASLQKLLHELGLTPEGRMKLGLDQETEQVEQDYF